MSENAVGGGWNRPNEANGADGKNKASTPTRGLVAGLLIVILAGTAAWFIFGRAGRPGRPQDAESARNAKIAEATPAIVAQTNVVEETKPKPVKIDPNARPTKVGEELNGYIKLPSGRLHRVKGVVTNTASANLKGKYAIFDHPCENEIACLLTLKPGDIIVGTPRYNGNFKKAFLESLKQPIVVTDKDSPEDAALKRAVTQAKIDMKAALDRGEDIEKMMLDTRKELQDLARYKFEIKMQLNEFEKKADVTPEDVEDFVGACNKLLEEKGIAPIKANLLTRRNFELKKQENQQ